MTTASLGLVSAVLLSSAAIGCGGTTTVAAAAKVDAGSSHDAAKTHDTGAKHDTGTTADTGSSGRPDAGAGDAACTPVGTVTFRMTGSADGGLTYASSFSNPGDGVWWYSVTTKSGAPVAIFFSGNAGLVCTGCQQLPPDAIGSECGQVPDGGVTATWNGTAVTGLSSCQVGTSAPAPCDVVSCEPAGEYVVKMCAGCDNASPTCVSVPFELPSTGEVVGTIPP